MPDARRSLDAALGRAGVSCGLPHPMSNGIFCALAQGHDGLHANVSGLSRWTGRHDPTPHPVPQAPSVGGADVEALRVLLHSLVCAPDSDVCCWGEDSPGDCSEPTGLEEGILSSDWLAARDARVRAEALRDAADRWERAVSGNTNALDLEVADRVVGWLRDRADQSEATP